MQRNSFFYKLLSNPVLYHLSQKVMSGVSFRENIAKKYIKKKKLNILDLGCGPADILKILDDVNYYGYDINKNYINYAKKKYFNKKAFFFCKKFTEGEIKKLPKFDVVLLFGIIHHLNDKENRVLFLLCKKVLKKKGFILTEDPIFVKKQNIIAKFLVKMDRGLHVRTKKEYLNLLQFYFKNVKCKIFNQNFIPYTWFVTRCNN